MEQVQDTQEVTATEQSTEATAQPITQEEADQIEKVMFEDDAEVKLRDGKTYKLMPFGLKDARRFMQKLKTINTEVIMLNLLDDMNGSNAEEDLYEVLMLAFKYNPLYKHVTIDYLGEFCDVVIARKIIEVLLGLNDIQLKK